MNLSAILPQGEFQQSLDRRGFGAAGSGSYRFDETPFGFGMEVQFNNYGADSREEPLSSTIPDLKVQVDNAYNHIAVLFAARFEPFFESPVSPYLEGLFGGNYFFTETTITNRFSTDEEPIARDTNIHDTVMAWGGGGGLQIMVYSSEKSFGGADSMPMVVFFNVGARYLYGNEATYLKEGSVTVANGQVSYEKSRSRTDLIAIQVGLTFKY